jgi:hypothetical protein
MDHGAHEEGVASVVAVHAVLGVVKDPGLPVVMLEAGIRPVLQSIFKITELESTMYLGSDQGDQILGDCLLRVFY